jgi:hypothetical protein
MYPVLIVGISFACATLWLLFLVTNAPSLPDDASLAFPSSLEELKQTATLLSDLFKQVKVQTIKMLHSFKLKSISFKPFKCH